MTTFFDQIKLLTVKKSVDQLALDTENMIKQQLQELSIDADVKVDIRCNSVNLDEFEKKILKTNGGTQT